MWKVVSSLLLPTSSEARSKAGLLCSLLPASAVETRKELEEARNLLRTDDCSAETFHEKCELCITIHFALVNRGFDSLNESILQKYALAHVSCKNLAK